MYELLQDTNNVDNSVCAPAVLQADHLMRVFLSRDRLVYGRLIWDDFERKKNPELIINGEYARGRYQAAVKTDAARPRTKTVVNGLKCFRPRSVPPSHFRTVRDRGHGGV